MLAYFFISLSVTNYDLIHETNLSDNDNNPAIAGPAATGPAGPGPTLPYWTMVDYTTLFMCVCHIHHNTQGHVLVFNYTNSHVELYYTDVECF